MVKRSGKRALPMRPKLGGGSKNQIQKLQADFARMQEEMKEVTVTATAGGGVVEVEVTGDQRIKSLRINPEVVDPEDVDMLQDLIVAAVNEGLDKSRSAMAEQLSGLTGGLGLEGML
ncbi:MAG: YbaB/EbfC family nucleoid-associated protein [Anaerolineae bacterium]|jgi:DNA-binding YbaB/EbfC family protein